MVMAGDAKYMASMEASASGCMSLNSILMTNASGRALPCWGGHAGLVAVGHCPAPGSRLFRCGFLMQKYRFRPKQPVNAAVF